MQTPRPYRWLALSLSLLACEAGDAERGLFDAAPQPVVPGPVVVDAGIALDAAPPVSNPPVANPPANPPASSDAGGAPPLDAAPPSMDAAPPQPTTDSGQVDAAAPASDAGGDAAPAAGEGGSAFPPVSDVSVKGPYTSKTINNTGPSGAYTIFYPAELAPNGVLNPILSWGNGGFTGPDIYTQLPHFASHGFVVIASNNSLAVSGAEVRAGIDWIVQQNETSSSPFYKKLDVKRIAGVGYSAGGLATLEVADDPRFLTIVIISGANTSESARSTNMPKLRTPIAYLCTDDDASKGNCASDFAVSKQPSFFGVMKGTGHVDVALGGDAVKLSATGSTAWLRWQVMGDQSYKSWFVGADCKLCKDSAWTVQQKNLQ